MREADAPELVAAERLSRYHGAFVAVEDVSFSIEPGRVAALLGPNGAGKTTILRMLTGYLAPSAGRARIAGYDVQRERIAAAALVGYLPENGPLYLDMTPLEMLHFFGEARGLAHEPLRDRIEAVARQCDIREILDKPIAKLSKGLRQRVGMAQALLHDPPVLLLDEPTAGLDPIQVRHFREQVRQLRERKTLLISTHVLQEVPAIADRLLVLHKGRLVFDGASDGLRDPGSLEDQFHEWTR